MILIKFLKTICLKQEFFYGVYSKFGMLGFTLKLWSKQPSGHAITSQYKYGWKYFTDPYDSVKTRVKTLYNV